MSASASPPRVNGPGKSLLELDPELGQLLTPERRELAEREVRVRATSFPVGEWDGGRLADADPMHLGLLISEGVLAREVVLGDTVSTELLGPGDILRPWHVAGPPLLLAVTIRWNALSAVRLGLIDRRAALALCRFPEIGAVIVDRMSERAHRLAITQAISQLNRVDRRLLALFWHLAERWGRVARDGIAVPLVLSHRLIGELVGARRPTVSTALADLAREGQLVRRDDGTWLLTGEPVAVPAVAAAEVVRQRRHLVPAATEPGPEREPATAPPARLLELRTSLEAARETAQRNREALDILQEETASLRERTIELRERRVRHVAELRAAASRRREG
jgi:CRP/FNR family cyclic AMP-dependent transcriptional regulator